MSDERVTFLAVSAIKNTWLRRLVILLTFPLCVLGNTWFVLVGALLAWFRSNISLVRSGAKQWQRKEQ